MQVPCPHCHHLLCTNTSSFQPLQTWGEAGKASNSRGHKIECPLQNTEKRKTEDFTRTLRYFKKQPPKKRLTSGTCRVYKGSTLSLRHPRKVEDIVKCKYSFTVFSTCFLGRYFLKCFVPGLFSSYACISISDSGRGKISELSFLQTQGF